MDSFFQFLIGLLAVASKTPVASIIILMLVSVIIGLIIINKNFKYIASHFPSPQVEKTQFHKAVVVYDEVEKSLDGLLHDLQAARVAVYQFSNGTTDLAKNPDMNCSMSFLAMRPGVGVDPSLLNARLPLNIFNDFTKVMWADLDYPIPVSLDVNAVRNPSMLAMFNTNGVEISFATPITSLDGSPVGILIAAYLDRTSYRPSDSDIFQEMDKLSTRIAGYLHAIKPKKKFLGLF